MDKEGNHHCGKLVRVILADELIRQDGVERDELDVHDGEIADVFVQGSAKGFDYVEARMRSYWLRLAQLS